MLIDFLTSRFFFLLIVFVAIAGYIGMVRFHLWSIGLRWSRDVWPEIRKSALAVAVYFGLVRLGFCLLIGFALLAGAII